MIHKAEALSQERQAYYNRLSDRLIEMCYAAINTGDWDRVTECAKLHLDLNRCVEYERCAVPHGCRWNSIDIVLKLIERFCKQDGWV